ncbi:MAG: orotidine-5'-phosphate decarboxylase [bacterium]|nr:orotidine-5'-phosphate decarboxylase [bacterium]
MKTPSASLAFSDRLRTAIQRAGSPLCVGLDPDPERIPPHLGTGIDAGRRFVRDVIESTRDRAAAFKANTAFFEAYGADGIALVEQIKGWIGEDVLRIADAKRGDVAHTNEAYAKAIFTRMRADAVTVQPYLGGEPLEPFLRNPSRGAFVLCATSNPGAGEIQGLKTENGPLYLEIAKRARTWNRHANVGLVLGTTKLAAIESVLEIASDLPLLLPGGGAQGGSTAEVLSLLKRKIALGLFTFSRSVIYASSGKDFADAARRECGRLKQELA